MLDFELTEEQQALVDGARRFTKEQIIPVAGTSLWPQNGIKMQMEARG